MLKSHILNSCVLVKQTVCIQNPLYVKIWIGSSSVECSWTVVDNLWVSCATNSRSNSNIPTHCHVRVVWGLTICDAKKSTIEKRSFHLFNYISNFYIFIYFPFKYFLYSFNFCFFYLYNFTLNYCFILFIIFQFIFNFIFNFWFLIFILIIYYFIISYFNIHFH